MSGPFQVTARAPGTPAAGEPASAASVAELAHVARGSAAGSRPIQLLGDDWLRWADRDRLGATLAAAGCDGPIEVVTSGLAYSRSSRAAAARAAAARAAGVTHATVRVPTPAFGAQADLALVARSFTGAAALVAAGVAVGVAVPVNRFTRGWLDELALAAARAGAVGFWPIAAAGSEPLARFAELARARFARVTATRLPPEPRVVPLAPLRELPGFDPAHCPWRGPGWPGDPPGPRAAIVCGRDGPPRLFALPPEATGDEHRLVWLKHTLEQVALAGAARPLRPAAPCVDCLRRLDCPAAWVAETEAATVGGEAWPAPPAAPRAMIDVEHLSHLRDRLAAVGPGESLVITGRSGRIVLGDADAAVTADPAVADPQLAADLAWVAGLETVRYGLPWGSRDDGWWLEVRRPAVSPGPGPRARQAVLMVTNVCVTRCLMCGLPNLFARAHSPVHHVLRHLTELRLLGSARVDLFGGEVSLRHDLLGLAEFGRRRGLRTSFITTGYRLGPPFLERLRDSAVDQIEVALDGATAAVHDHVKGGLDVFADATRVVRALVDDRRRVVGVNTVMLKENLEQLTATVALAAEFGVDESRFFSCVRFMLYRGLQEPLTLADAARLWDEVIPATRRLAAARRLSFEVCGGCRFDEEPREVALAAFIDGRPNALPRLRRRCVAPRTDLTIGIDGSLAPCQNPSFFVDVVRRPKGALTRPVWEVRELPEMAALAAEAGLLPACEHCICFREERGAAG